MVTTRELAIAGSVIYASLDDYPLTLEELHESLVGSPQTLAEVLSVYEGSEMLQNVIERRDGFFFPAGRGDLVDERRRREARSRAFLDRHSLLLRLVCSLPFVRLVALSGRISRLNLEAGGDIDLFIVTRGCHVWSTAAAVRVLARIMSRRCMVRAKVIVDDLHLVLEPRDPATAAQLLHLKPLVGAHVLRDVFAANPCVAQFYPNALEWRGDTASGPSGERRIAVTRTMLELVLGLPSPLVEAACRWLLGGGDTLVEMPPRLPHSNDLFKIFPDLPGHRLRTAEEQVRKVHQQVEEFRERARINIDRQRAAAARVRVRAKLADRRRR
jgi:hypothetical protein